MADGALGLRAGNGFDPAAVAESPNPTSVAFGVPGFLAPQSLGEVRELARMIALAEWAPDCYCDLDGNYLQPKIELAILHGATVGLGPIAAVHAIALIGGKPSIWGDGALSVIEHSGLLEDMVEDYELDDDDGLTAICTMKRRDRPTPIVTRFSMAMAERAGLTRTEGPWQTYPERMLRMRARSWTMRDGFADVLRGLQLHEEVEDYVGSRGGRSFRAPHREGSQPGSLRHSPLPRPRRLAGSNGASRPDHRPTMIAEPVSERDEGAPIAGPGPATETYALIDADGVLIEVVGADALQAGFERLTFDKHLTPDQVAGVWESNEVARRTIERLFGPEALTQAREHLHSTRGERNPPNDGGQPRSEMPVLDAASGSEHPEQDQSGSDRSLLLEINPIWGAQKIFQQYRAALTALDDSPARNKPVIARFRQANLGVEQRLRAKLPGRLGPIDAIYRRDGLEP
jgi:hypothetical protein